MIKIHNKIKYYIFYYNQHYKSSFFIPFIFNQLGKELPTDNAAIVNYSFNLFILSLIALVCFINVVGYFLSFYLINKYDITNKYPKYIKLINYYEKSTLIFIILESLICLLCLIFMVIINFFMTGLIIFKS